MPVTDYHAACAAAVKSVVEGLALGPPVVAADDIEDGLKVAAMPAILVCPVGPEQDRPELTTNAQDGISYSVSVALLAPGVVNGAKGQPLTPTAFLRELRVAFHNRRLTGVSQVAYCEVSTAPVLFDKDSPSFQKIQTVGTVVCVGRWPRT